MKLINRKHTYYSPDITESTVYNGQIQCTRKEWQEAIKRLMRSSKWVGTSTYARMYKDILQKDIAKGVPDKGGMLYAIRVPATAQIAKWYGLTNYKQDNFTFLVKG